MADLQSQLKTANFGLAEAKGNLIDTRRQLQGLTVEIDGLRSTVNMIKLTRYALSVNCRILSQELGIGMPNV